jgi:hypothetical protein
MKIAFLITLFTFYLKVVFSQSDNNYITWSDSQKLNINNFTIRKSDSTNFAYIGSFVIYFHRGFVKIGKNYNKNVEAQMLKSASWIDTSYSPISEIRILQDEFDLCEVYTRKLRKKLKEETHLTEKKFKKIYADVFEEFQIQLQLLSKDMWNCSKGCNDRLETWETKIQGELITLDQFTFNN